MKNINEARGETSILINGKPHKLCLTLGALAQIEHSLEITELSELSARLQGISANDVLSILAALLQGGANPMTISQLKEADIHPNMVAEAIAKAFRVVDSAP